MIDKDKTPRTWKACQEQPAAPAKYSNLAIEAQQMEKELTIAKDRIKSLEKEIEEDTYTWRLSV